VCLALWCQSERLQPEFDGPRLYLSDAGFARVLRCVAAKPHSCVVCCTVSAFSLLDTARSACLPSVPLLSLMVLAWSATLQLPSTLRTWLDLLFRADELAASLSVFTRQKIPSLSALIENYRSSLMPCSFHFPSPFVTSTDGGLEQSTPASCGFSIPG
jgi:hypothetical protein